jgi:hypothetical protein
MLWVRVVVVGVPTLSGCFLMHGLEDEPIDAGLGDAGAAAPPDSGTEPDPICRFGFPGDERRIDGACIDGAAAVAGAPIEIVVVLDVGHCGDEILCTTTVGPDGALDVVTTHCPSPDDCIIPPPLTGICTLPALESGLWRVRVNGHDAFDLPVRDPEDDPIDAAATCWSMAPAVDVGAVCAWPGELGPRDEICHRSDVVVGTSGVISVQNDCACGNLRGACRVSVSGDRIAVEAPWRDCGSRCRDTCASGEDGEARCWLPTELAPGTYVVDVDGVAETSRLVVHPSSDPPREPSTVCVGG